MAELTKEQVDELLPSMRWLEELFVIVVVDANGEQLDRCFRGHAYYGEGRTAEDEAAQWVEHLNNQSLNHDKKPYRALRLAHADALAERPAAVEAERDDYKRAVQATLDEAKRCLDDKNATIANLTAPVGDVQRWEVDQHIVYASDGETIVEIEARMTKLDEGRYVLYADHARLTAERDAAKAQIDKMHANGLGTDWTTKPLVDAAYNAGVEAAVNAGHDMVTRIRLHRASRENKDTLSETLDLNSENTLLRLLDNLSALKRPA